jgi:hypothetical protein
VKFAAFPHTLNGHSYGIVRGITMLVKAIVIRKPRHGDE